MTDDRMALMEAPEKADAGNSAARNAPTSACPAAAVNRAGFAGG